MDTFTIIHGHGLTEPADTYEEALDRVCAVYGEDCVIGHDGDIDDGGERTLCWVDEQTADADDGSRACCVIRRRHAAEVRS